MSSTLNEFVSEVSPAVRDADIAEPDCGQYSAQHLAQGLTSRYTRLAPAMLGDPGEQASVTDWLTTLGDWSALIASPEDEIDAFIAENASTFLEAGGAWDGSEAPVQRVIAIALRSGLEVTGTARANGSHDSDHHVEQTSAFAVDLSNAIEPTPEMDRVARQIAAALGVPDWQGGAPLVCERNGLRAHLLWRTHDHCNHIHFGCRRT